jgi:nucleoside-diphosphate-sugar epimerase
MVAVVSNFVVQALRNEPLTIYRNGEQTRSFCYIDDLAFGPMMATADHVTGPCNLGNPHEVTIGGQPKTPPSRDRARGEAPWLAATRFA